MVLVVLRWDDITSIAAGPGGFRLDFAEQVIPVPSGDSEEVEIPARITNGPGSYRIRAESSDATAIFEFRIAAAADGPPASKEHKASIGFHRGGPAAEVIALSAVLAVVAVLGPGLLLWRERPAA